MNTKVTAGRDYLGAFAPKFAALNDDVLFGEVWSRQGQLSPKMRSIITISALMGAGVMDESLTGHLETGKANGISRSEIVEIITQLAFYTGWPKGWAAFSKAMEIWEEEDINCGLFGADGTLLDDKEHFTGRVWVREVYGLDRPLLVDNVTFEPGCRNSWHIHQAGQTLLVTDGRGWYQEEGKAARELHPGDIVEIPGGVKHWHGAAKDCWFSHLTFEDPSRGAPEWLEKVDEREYAELP